MIQSFGANTKLIAESIACAPVVTSKSTTASSAIVRPATTGSLTVAMNLTSHVGEPVVQKLGRRQKAGAAVVLRIFEHQEEVHVTDQNANELHDASASDDHVECKQHPGKVHGFELSAEPKVDNDVLVELTPDVEDAKNHGIHEEGDVHHESDDDAADPVEEKHEAVVGRAAFKDSGLQSQRVVVQEVEVDQEVKSCLWRQRIVEEGGDGPPQMEPVHQVFPHQHQPARREQAKTAEQCKQNGASKPISGENGQALEPVLKIVSGRHLGNYFPLLKLMQNFHKFTV